MTKLSAIAKQGRVVAAKVDRTQRAAAVTRATGRVSAAATTGDRVTKASTPAGEGAPAKRAGWAPPAPAGRGRPPLQW